MMLYWAACLGVIGVGLDRLHPQVRQGIVETLAAGHGERPFANCAAAHAAGFYDIPSGSPTYAQRQDRDGDGLACERLWR